MRFKRELKLYQTHTPLLGGSGRISEGLTFFPLESVKDRGCKPRPWHRMALGGTSSSLVPLYV